MTDLPSINHRQLNLFLRYIRWYLRRNFHRLHLAWQSPLPPEAKNLPVLVCMNHPSWWDPLLALYLAHRLFGNRGNYGPIANAGLAKYKMFERLGFFGIDNTARSGAQRFLQVGSAALGTATASLWVTPQGHFKDVRLRPVTLENGVGHLARRCHNFLMLPLALEYSFWNERYSEAFACFGQSIFVENGREHTGREWTEIFAAALGSTQDHLAHLVITRNEAAFEPLLEGVAGVGGIYDLWRSVRARLGGRKFEPGHGRI